MPRLLIVSNRLPFTVHTERGDVSVVPSTGGLATAMRGPHERYGGLWIGWPGDISRLSAEQRSVVDRKLVEQRTVPVALSAGEASRYYNGFSNGVLWPLFHYLLDKVRMDARRDFDTYEAVNDRFAALVAERYRPGDMIWIHDYHLMLVPELVRRRLPSAAIGFFLHIPFPSEEIFRTLPYRERLLRGLLGADLLGFHTASYRG
jgi:trehalose 6-phosphate synthase/phosphatase